MLKQEAIVSLGMVFGETPRGRGGLDKNIKMLKHITQGKTSTDCA
jgi:hypothetical protein